ncbi:hypothetical protein [Streptomyces xantholiticus]|uniref:hypothetical protein n=1 Tax=Streptomyces xantholiticus TaxID=68285 RepID=UPI0016760FF9|nr:hypothetical protein [Streptomyces xantholiticus]GGW62076.1 hypothetical protein GCM10010381_53940 [Streptomyces xantholiticus]
MTVPEENRAKTRATKDVVTKPAAESGAGSGAEEGIGEGTPTQPGQASGRTLREALDEAGIKPEDYES